MSNAKPFVVRSLVWWCLFLVFMLATNPFKMPLIVLIVPFLLVFLAVSNSVKSIMAGRRTGDINQLTASRFGLPAVLGVLAVSVLALGSIGQLTGKDLLTILLLLSLGSFYLSRNRSN